MSWSASRLMPLAVVVACVPSEPASDQEPLNPLLQREHPCLALTVDAVDFGTIEVGIDAPASQVVTLSNCDDQTPVFIEELEVHGEYVSLDDGLHPYLEPGDQTEVMLTFAPSTVVELDGALVVDVQDGRPTRLPLAGIGVAPALGVSPERLDLSVDTVGCSVGAPVRLTNDGTADLEVSSVHLWSATDELSFTTTGPLTLAPGEEEWLPLVYAPVDLWDDAGWIEVFSNDPLRPLMRVPIAAAALDETVLTEVFTQPATDEVDVLVVVDTSSSMQADFDIHDELTELFDELRLSALAYQLLGLVEDDGCSSAELPWIAPDDSDEDAETAWTAMFTAEDSARYSEALFTIAEAALWESRTGGCNEGLRREQAPLELVFVTDEPEQSINPYTYYVSTLQRFALDPDDVRMHAVAGDYPSGCGDAAAGTGYFEASVATGAEFLSICGADWGATLAALFEEEHSARTRWTLESTPVDGTVEVRVDGIAESRFELDGSTLVLDADAAAVPGAEIVVSYVPASDCG